MATTYTVSATAGRDTNPGTSALPFQTLTRAAAAVAQNAGDTVVVESGTYVEAGTTAAPKAALYLLQKSGTTWQGSGPTRPVIDGGGTMNVGISIPKANNSMQNTVIRGFEIRNFKSKGIDASYPQGTASNNLVEDCVIHHIQNRAFVTAADNFPRYQDGINISGGNPTIRNCEIHHIGYGGEAHGIWLQNTFNALVDACDVYMVRKDAIRAGASMNPTIQNSRWYLSTNGISFEQCVGGQAFNNFAYLCASGLACKHDNDPAEALSVWALPATAWQLLRLYHNTTWMCTDESQYIAGNLDPTTANPDRGALWHTEWKNNLYSGTGLRHFRDAPQARQAGVITDYNVYQSKPGQTTLHWYFNTGTGNYTEDMATLTSGAASPADPSKTIGWEEHGRFMAFDFVDAGKGNLNPTAPIPGLIDLGTPFGSQVGARLSTTARAQWRQNPLVVVSAKSAGKPTSRLVDDYGSQTSYDTDTSTDEWLVVDQGAATTNHIKWDVWGHQQPKVTKSYTLEVSSSPTGPWTNLEDGLMNDNFGSFFIFEYPNFTGRYLRWTSHDVFGATTPVIAFSGIQAGLLTPTSGVTPPPPPPPPAAPVNTIAPVISPDTARPGDTLQVTQGTWQGSPTSYRIVWLRDNAIVGSVWGTFHWGTGSWSQTAGAGYVVTTADVGHTITARVTATNDVGSTQVVSSNTVTPTAAPPQTLAPANTIRPVISTDTSPEPGETVTCSTGTWDNTPTTFAFAWTAGGAAAGTGSSYVIKDVDVGKDLICTVTASNSAGAGTPAPSQAVRVLAPPPPPPPPDPTSADSEGFWGSEM